MPPHALSALRDTFPSPGGIPGTSVSICPRTGLPLYTACGISWTSDDVSRFLERVVLPQSSRCHIWDGAKSRGQGNSQWYGSFYTQGKTVRAHKFAAVAILGLRPGPGDELDHDCNNSLCVRHLVVRTRAQNQERIRRPTKKVLALARFCNMTAAEVMILPPDKIDALHRLMEAAKSLERGRIPRGVIVTRERKRR